MIVNRSVAPRNIATIRDLVESFGADKLSLPALTMKLADGSYWRLSYGELQEHVRALAAGLAAAGVRKADRIALLAENRSEWIIAYLAVTWMGAVIVPLDILAKAEELAPILQSSRAGVAFTSTQYLDRLLEAHRLAGSSAAPPALKRIVLFDGDGPRESATGFEVRLFAEMLAAGRRQIGSESPPVGRDVVRPDDLAALIYTSGTTGEPKGVMLSHRNIMSNADGVQMTTRLGPGDNWVVALPLHHTYPTTLGIFVPLLSYGMITPVASLKSHLLIEIMRETGATCIPAVPALVERFYKGIWATVDQKPAPVRLAFRLLFGLSAAFRSLGVNVGRLLFRSVADQLGLKKLRFFVSGGGPISKQIIDGMQTLGLTTFQGYGLTEASPVVSTTCPGRDRPGTVGLPLANLEVRLAEPDAEGNGEILVRGPNIMQGYEGHPELTREVIDEQGFLHTGDLGTIDRDGYLAITGRIKNLIVTSGGKNIYPEEIENRLLESPYIAEAVVIGRNDPEHGELPYAIVHPNMEALALAHGGRAPEGEELRRLMAQEIHQVTRGLAPYKVPTGFEVSLEELPKTSTRKVKRFLVRR